MKTTRQDNHRVVVYPDFGYTHTLKDHRIAAARKDICEQVAAAIKRHVDDVEEVEVLDEPVSTCSYCGMPWTEEGDGYNGGCCAEDAQHAPAEEVGS